MKNKCFDIGTIQAFIDGELASDLSEKVIKHIALCNGCATMLAETEEESTLAFSVLDEELNCLVPTERLRTKVFDSIEEIERKEKSSWWKTFVAGLGFANGFGLKSPGLVAFASVVLFVSMLAIGVKFYEPMPTTDAVAELSDTNIDSAQISEIDVNTPVIKDISSDTDSDESQDNIVETPVNRRIIKANSTNKVEKRFIKARGTRNKVKPQKAVEIKNRPKNVVKPSPPKPKVSTNLAEEGGYLQTIATLKRTVDLNKDMALRPSERISYERDLAVVNDAIKKMKAEVRKNPKNKAAREVLRSSYKNKIDLLNSVAEKTELMASIQ